MVWIYKKTRTKRFKTFSQDLDEAEEQYSMAFRSQIDTIAYMTEVHNQRLNDLVGKDATTFKLTIRWDSANYGLNDLVGVWLRNFYIYECEGFCNI